jgi:hypothetical protein
MKEPFPRLRDYKSLWHFATYPCLTVQDPSECGGTALYSQIGAKQYRTTWCAFYKDNKICTGFITKQWRHQSYGDAEDRGCDQSTLKRMGGWKHDQKDVDTKAERDHYATNVPLKGMLALAHGDSKEPRHFYISRFVQVHDDFLKLFQPFAAMIEDHESVAEHYAEYETRKAQCRDRMATAYETGFNALEELRCGFRLLASRPVDHRRLNIITTEPCYFTKYRNCSTLKPFFDHSAFQSELWKDLCRRVRESEDAEASRVFTIPPCVRNDLDMFKIEIGNMLGNFSTQVFHQCQQMRDLMREQTLRIQHSATDHSGLVLPPATSIRHSNANTDTSPGRRPVIPVPAPPASSTNPAKKRRISHEAVARAEVPFVDEGVCPRPLLIGRDRLFNSAREYWRLWKDEFEPLEKQYQQNWRNDRPYVTQDKDGKIKTKKPNAKATWWNERKYIWVCIAHWIDQDNMTEDDAIAKAESLYDGCRRSNGKKPLLRDLHKSFSQQAKELGIHSVGRPSKSNDDHDPSAAALGHSPPDDRGPAPPPPVPTHGNRRASVRSALQDARRRDFETRSGLQSQTQPPAPTVAQQSNTGQSSHSGRRQQTGDGSLTFDQAFSGLGPEIAQIHPHDHAAKDAAWAAASVGLRELYAEWTISQLLKHDIRSLDEHQWRIDLHRLERFVPSFSPRAADALGIARQRIAHHASEQHRATVLAQAAPGTGTYVPNRGFYVSYPTRAAQHQADSMRQIQRASGRSFSHHDMIGGHRLPPMLPPPPTPIPDNAVPFDLGVFADNGQTRMHERRF